MRGSAVVGERYASKVGALFTSADDAWRAADAVAAQADVERSQIRVIEPGDDRDSRKLEPESRGIARTLIRSHVTLGVAGALAGMVLAGILMLLELRLFTASPWATVVWLAAFGAVAGLLLGGFVSLRPDHDPLNMKIEEAMRDGGHWAVVVHTRDHEQAARARDTLESWSGEVIATL